MLYSRNEVKAVAAATEIALQKWAEHLPRGLTAEVSCDLDFDGDGFEYLDPMDISEEGVSPFPNFLVIAIFSQGEELVKEVGLMVKEEEGALKWFPTISEPNAILRREELRTFEEEGVEKVVSFMDCLLPRIGTS